MPNGAKNWCGTLQLEDETFDGQTFLQKLFDDKIITYGVGQVERGSHLHFQFYLSLSKRSVLKTMKKINGSAHWEVARGSPKQNKAYCTKEDTRVSGPWEVGEPIGQGHRSDLDVAGDMIADGTPVRDVADTFRALYIRYNRGFHALERTLKEKGDRKFGPEGPEVWIFWGPAGTGKSRKAFETWPDAYVKMTADKWWDGYEGQDTVIFDDFKGSSMRLHDFQRVIDRYPTRVEFKGGSITLSATRYVFTSNKHPSEWYSADADPHGTVMRRVNEFCVDRGRLFHCLGNWNGGQSERPRAEVSEGNTYASLTPASITEEQFLQSFINNPPE